MPGPAQGAQWYAAPGPYAVGPDPSGHRHHAHLFYPAYGMAWGPPTGVALAQVPGTPALGLLNNRFIMGMIVGGALTYVLTNEAVQRRAIRGITELWLSIQGTMEETKERFRDAASEIKAGQQK